MLSYQIHPCSCLTESPTSAARGSHQQGQATAELDIHPNLWFFNCHFLKDPVMPGCLGMDALWQVSGFYLAWLGCPGRGRALGCGEVKFSGQVTQKVKKSPIKSTSFAPFKRKPN